METDREKKKKMQDNEDTKRMELSCDEYCIYMLWGYRYVIDLLYEKITCGGGKLGREGRG